MDAKWAILSRLAQTLIWAEEDVDCGNNENGVVGPGDGDGDDNGDDRLLMFNAAMMMVMMMIM